MNCDDAATQTLMALGTALRKSLDNIHTERKLEIHSNICDSDTPRLQQHQLPGNLFIPRFVNIADDVTVKNRCS